MIEQILLLFGLGCLAFFLLFLAWKKGFFSIPSSENWKIPIQWYHVIILFGIYFLFAGLFAPLIILGLKKLGVSFQSIDGAVWINFISSVSILILFGIYLFLLPKEIPQKIWRQKKSVTSEIYSDIRFAVFTWVIAFPLIIFSNQLFEFILDQLFHPIIPEQLAVRFLKMTFQIPHYFFLTSITIAICAPLIEEILFRGFLQSFIRQHLSVNHSIVITALCFSLFHYSPEQGIANFSIIPSLFILALFLGYIYDRKQSLLAPIALHAIFNTLNIFNLYFFGGYGL